MCLSKNSYIASNPFSWNVFQLCGDEPTQQPDSIVLNHLEQKTRHGGFYGAGLSQDERKDQALVWSTWRVAPQSGRLSGRKKGRGAKVFFSGDRSSYHCCNSDRLLQQLAPSTIQMLQVRLSHYSHQLYSEFLGAPFISTIHLSGITEAMAFTKGR